MCERSEVMTWIESNQRKMLKEKKDKKKSTKEGKGEGEGVARFHNRDHTSLK